MPDHIHLITDGSRTVSDVLRFTSGITARRVIDYLKAKDFKSSLEKLRQGEKKRKYKYSLWQHHADAFLLTSETTFGQKVNYIHQNPVRAGLIGKPEDYRFSSARIWQKTALDKEPLRVDMNKMEWRQSRKR